MSVVTPVPASVAATTSTACPNCGASVAADQRYCLSCGRPCSPVRLAFLDVLQAEHATPQLPPGQGGGLAASGTILPPTLTYLPASEPDGPRNWLQRHSGLLGLLSVLLLAGLIGLLVGHWITGSATSGAQVVKVEYPNGLPAATGAAAAAPTTSAPTSSSAVARSTSAKAASSHQTQASEEKEAKEIESKPAALPKPVTKNQSDLKHFESTTGKKHVEEANKLANGTAPIETHG